MRRSGSLIIRVAFPAFVRRPPTAIAPAHFRPIDFLQERASGARSAGGPRAFFPRETRRCRRRLGQQQAMEGEAIGRGSSTTILSVRIIVIAVSSRRRTARVLPTQSADRSLALASFFYPTITRPSRAYSAAESFPCSRSIYPLSISIFHRSSVPFSSLSHSSSRFYPASCS